MVLDLVEKKVFETPELKTTSGRVIKNVRFGYETHGRLNAAGDNAILVTHYFTGTSHCAGKYSEADLEPGYWDAIIGPGKPIDTNRFFVVSADTLCNINTGDTRVVTTGPASIDPETGRPYGMRFPHILIRDFVEAQRALVEHLGIRRLHAVAGPSMGCFQAFEWAVSYPEMVDRVLAVIPGSLESEPYLIALLQTWMAPIVADPNWWRGDYYDGPGPEQGLTDALRLVTINALHYQWARKMFDRRPAVPGKDPLDSHDNLFAIEKGLEDVARTRAKIADANSAIYLCKAVQRFTVKDRLHRMRAKVLALIAESDLLLFPDYGDRAVADLREAGVRVESAHLKGDVGHLDGLQSIAQASDLIRGFLN